jgi:hypothetical protein
MRRFLLCLSLLFPLCAPPLAWCQSDNTLYVKLFPGATVAAKVAAAELACNANVSIPCILVLDPSLAGWAPGSMPILAANVSLEDYRAGSGGGLQNGSGEYVVTAADPTGNFDSTAAIQAALYQAGLSSILAGGSVQNAYTKASKVLLPKGRYLTTSMLQLPSGVLLEGAGTLGFDPCNVTGANTPGTVIDFEPTNTSLYAIRGQNFIVSTGLPDATITDVTSSSVNNGTESEARNIGLKDLSVCTLESGVSGLILFTGATQSQLENVTASGSANPIRVSTTWMHTSHRVLATTAVAGAVAYMNTGAANGSSIRDVYGASTGSGGTAIGISGCSGCDIASLTVEHSAYGLSLTNAANAIHGVHAEALSLAVIQDLGNTQLTISGLDATAMSGAVLYTNPTGDTSNLSLLDYNYDSTITQVIGNLDPYTSLRMSGKGLASGDTYPGANLTNNIQSYQPYNDILNYGGAAHTGIIALPNSGANLLQFRYQFAGADAYAVKWTPTNVSFFDWSSGNARIVLFDKANSATDWYFGWSPTGYSDGGTTQTWRINSATGMGSFNGGIANANGTILPSTLNGVHGNAAKVQLSDNSGTGGDLASFDANGNVTDSNLVAANVVRRIYNCGSTSACGSTILTQTKLEFGSVPLSSGSATITGMSAWTSTSSFGCTCADTATTPAACAVQNTSTSSITIKGTGSDVVTYTCEGN